ncbi:MAG TPA: hypothetical protein VK069_02425 [Mycolicibacillus parakoreensis]|nr:hypothetical protein [Mycolicibacillus parakoreensis]
MRFNPPPNWPPPPPGWAPDATWQPDPAWGPPPPGWPLWVDDAAGPPPGGYPLPYPPQRSGGPSPAVWITLAALVVVVALGAAAFFVFGRSASTGTDPSDKAAITTLSKDLLVERSAFPDLGDAQWHDWANDGTGVPSGPQLPGDLDVSPRECADLFGGPDTATQDAGARLVSRGLGGLRSLGVHLAISDEQPDVHAYLSECREFTIRTELPGLDQTMDMTGTVDALDAPGVPAWAVGYRTETSSSVPGIPVSTAMQATAISGVYRGVLVEVSYEQISSGPAGSTPAGTDLTDDLVALFNAQVDKLDAAP